MLRQHLGGLLSSRARNGAIGLALLLGILAGGGVSSAAGPPFSDPVGPDVVPVDGGNALAAPGSRTAPDRLLVRFRADTGASRRADIRQSVGAAHLRSYRLVPGLELLRVPPSQSVLDTIARLKQNPNVEYAEPDRVFRIETTPNDTLYSNQWDMSAVNAPQAWARTTGSSSVTVGVIDTGVDVTHPDLAANIWTNAGEIPANGIDDDGNGYIDDVHGWDFRYDDNTPNDVYGHGTHVAGTVGAVGNNVLGVTGVNWSVTLMPLKICSDDGFCNTSDEVAALDYALDKGVKIANASFGGNFGDQAEQDAIDAAGTAGLLYVAAAGNNGSDNDSIGFYPAGYPLDNIVAVAASNQAGGLAGFSNFGAQSVDVVAPGEGILSTMVTTGVLSNPTGYGQLSGTSMAAPHVAGAAALLWAEHSTWTMAQVRDRLLSTVQPMTAAVGKVKSCGALDLGAATDPAVGSRELVCLKRRGSGAGSVSSSPAGISCGSTCAAAFAPGTTVTLTATPAAGSTFNGWSGAGCSGTGTCVVSPAAIAFVVATFRKPGSPPGWTQAKLTPPGSRQPFVPGSPAGQSFYRVSISADGLGRAKTIFNRPATFCAYDTADTGGIFLQRKAPSGWVSDGTITAPYVYASDESEAAPGGARWTNCSDFGRITKLSGNGGTLLVSQPTAATSGPVAGRFRCVAFVYDRAGGAWNRTGTLFPPGVDAAGSTDPTVCNYFGTDGAISADGNRVAILGSGYADVYVRGVAGWTHEQRLTFAPGSSCGSGGGLALSGNGSRLLAGDPFCEGAGGVPVAGRVYAYGRSGSTWTLETTLLPPQNFSQTAFGSRVALSQDGSTAAISGSHDSSLPEFAGAAWVFEHDSTGWHLRTRVTASSPQERGAFGCSFVAAAGERLLCDELGATVGSNEQQGALYKLDRPASGWATGSAAVRAYATDGAAFDQLSNVAANGAGTLIDATILPDNNGNGSYPNDRLGYEFTIAAADGVGTMAVSPASVRSNTTGNTLTFTYTAAAGGISNGTVAIAVPSGWSAPSTTATAPGFFTSNVGTRTVSSGQMVVSGLTLAAGAKLSVVYGSKSQGGPGASSPTSGIVQTWVAKERSSSTGALMPLAASPSVTVLARDGSGTIGASPTSVTHGSTGRTIVFTYRAAAGGMANGMVTIAVPSGWSPPSTTGTAAGYTSSGAGTVSISNRIISVTGVTLAGGAVLKITYGSKALAGPGATAPATAVGAQAWVTKQRSSGSGVLTQLAASPSISVT